MAMNLEEDFFRNWEIDVICRHRSQPYQKIASRYCPVRALPLSDRCFVLQAWDMTSIVAASFASPFTRIVTAATNKTHITS